MPTTTPGEKIATIDAETFTVDVYQVGTAKASKTGQWVDPETNQPLIAEGDEIVYVNYVFTNTGTESIPLTYSLVTVTPTYADWEYLQGMDSIVDSEQFEEMGVTSFAIDPMNGGEAPSSGLRARPSPPARTSSTRPVRPSPSRRACPPPTRPASPSATSAPR